MYTRRLPEVVVRLICPFAPVELLAIVRGALGETVPIPMLLPELTGEDAPALPPPVLHRRKTEDDTFPRSSSSPMNPRW